MGKTKKNYNLEIIRTISFIFVVLIHVSNYFCRGYGQVTGAGYLFSLFCDTVARISVPCFFMISGALMLERNEGVERGLKRVWRFLIILIFWSVVYYLFEHFYMGDYFDMSRLPFEPVEAHLWYLYAMLPIYIMLPFFQVMVHAMTEKQEQYFMALCFLLSAFVYCASFSELELYYDIPIIGDRVYAVCFFLGYYIRKYAPRLKIPARIYFLFFGVCCIINVITTAFMTHQTGDHYERFLEYGNPVTLLSGAAFFGGMILLKNGDIQVGKKEKK
ncbi:MAG: acyltransferase family protein [Hespellia sp.]|nr:acyltransferase family protein [Hespellia sp.]